MTCRVCRHWKGDLNSWNEDNKPKVSGPCHRDPVPVETLSTYCCSSVSVDADDARHWLSDRSYFYQKHEEKIKELKATKATLERVRARVRNLKKQRARVSNGTP